MGLEIFNGYTPHSGQGLFHASKAKYRAILSGIGFGKCLKEGTLVTMSDGTTKEIQDIQMWDKVITYNGFESMSSRVLGVCKTGIKEAYKVRLQGGYEIVCSADHRFYVSTEIGRKRIENNREDNRVNYIKNCDWVKAEDLKRMSLVSIPKHYSRDTEDLYGGKFYELTGYLIGDGCLRNRIDITAENFQVIDRISSLIPQFITLKRRGKQCYLLSSHLRDEGGHGWNPLIDKYRDLGLFNTTSHTKFIPKRLLKASNKNLFRLLSGLIVTDGWIDKIGVGYCTVSDKLRDDIRTLLHNLGISHVCTTRRVKYKERLVEAHQFHITRLEDLKKISSNCILLHKGNKLKKLIASKPKFPTHKGINKLYIEGDLSFRRVLSVESCGEEAMYDLHIEGTHNFVANNILVHNSAAGANEIIRMAMTHGRTPEGDPIMYLILAPTSKMMQTSTLIQFFKWCPREIIAGRRRSESLIYLTSGATIVYLTADNQRHIERLRGMELGGFWADEASLLLFLVWRILLGRLRAQGAPLKGVITTTPRGKNWIHYYFMRKVHPRTKEPLDASKYEWFGGSTLENPHTPEEYKQDLLSNYVGKFAEQEIYGKIVSFEGMVYDNFNESIHVIDYEPKNIHRFIMGADWGFTNEMGGLIIGIDGDGRYYILEEFYRKKAYPEKLGDWIIAMHKKYPLLEEATAYADPSEPGNILKLHEMGIYVVGANNAVMPGIQDVYTQFEVADDKKPRLYIHMRCYNTLEELSQYRYEDAKEGKENKDVPLKVEDHLMDAMRYAIHSHMRISGKIVPLEDPENLMGFA